MKQPKTQKEFEHQRRMLVNQLIFHEQQSKHHQVQADYYEQQLRDFDETYEDRLEQLRIKKQDEYKRSTLAALAAKQDKTEQEVHEELQRRTAEAKARSVVENMMKGFQPIN